MDFSDRVEQGTRIVEVIEDGKISRVSEEYALREGLPIIRKGPVKFASGSDGEEDKKKDLLDAKILGADDFRRPLDREQSKITKELMDNFHWQISRKRREKGLRRKEFAEALGEKEDTVKLLENGILENNDFVLIDKVQDFLGISLRKDEQKIGSDTEMRRLVEEAIAAESGESAEEEKKDEKKGGFAGDDIEIIE